MPAWSINLLEALQEIAEVENCLLDGHPPDILHGKNVLKTATRVAAERMSVDPQSLRGRIGTPEVPGRIWRRWQLKVEWGLYKPRSSDDYLNNDEIIDDRIASRDRVIEKLKGEIDELHEKLKPKPLSEKNPEFAVDNAPPQAFVQGAAIEIVSNPDNTFLFGAAGDLHAASKYCRWDVREDLYRQFIEAGCTCNFDAGNWIDGEARFNVHDLMVHGLDRQCQHLAQNHPKGLKTYAIWGDDHEGWYVQREGIDVGRYNESVMRAAGHDWTDLGFMEAHVSLKNYNSGKLATLAIAHPGGGSAYAVSYSIQKIIESLEGGQKPAVGVYGHYHKLWAGLIRNVFCVQTGCQQDQTPFLRKKHIEAHVGGTIIKLRQDPATGAITSMTPELIRYFNVGYYAGSGRWSKHGDVVPLERKQIGSGL